MTGLVISVLFIWFVYMVLQTKSKMFFGIGIVLAVYFWIYLYYWAMEK